MRCKGCPRSWSSRTDRPRIVASASWAAPPCRTCCEGTSPGRLASVPARKDHAVPAGQEQGFQLRRRDRTPVVLDQLLQAVHDEEIALVVGVADVAGVEPPLRVDHGRRRLRPAEIALHDLRAPHADLALLAGGELAPA